MLDANNLAEIIKRAALDAVNAGQLCDFCYGTVTSDAPLKILVEQKLELSAAQLVLCRNVTDYEIKITGGNTRDDYYTEFPDSEYTAGLPVQKHVHAVGEAVIKVHNALKKGEKVVLLRKRGGQEYLVADRVVKA